MRSFANSSCRSIAHAPADLARLALLAALAACGGGPSSSTAPGAGYGFFQFDLRTDVTVGNAGLIDGVLRDIDADGLADLVSCDFEDHLVALGRGTALGGFAPMAYLSTPSAPWTVALADFGGDGRLDLAVACVAVLPGESNAVVLFEQASTGLFLKTDVFALPVRPFDVAAGALLGNGRSQVLVTLIDQRETWILDLSAPGALVRADVLESQSIGEGLQQSVEALDLDHDGDLDVLAGEIEPAGSGDRLVAWRNDGAGGFADAELVQTGLMRPLLSPTGDVDLDGWADLAIAQMDAPDVLLVLTREAAPPLVSSHDMGHGSTSALFRDLDGDGLPELAATLWKRQTLAVRAGIGPGAFGPLRNYNVGSAPRNVTALALPGDTMLDLACVNIGDVSLLYQKKGEFVAARGYELGAPAAALVCADLDLDGAVDVLTLDAGAGEVVVMRGAGDGSFAQAYSVAIDPALTPTPGFLCIADMTGDLLPDLVVTVLESDEVRVFPNVGGLEFDAPWPGLVASVGDEPGGIAAGDLDDDGDQDLIVAHGDDTYRVLLQEEDGSLTVGPPVAAGARPVAALLVHLDDDGLLDLVLSAGEPDGTQNRLLVLSGQPGATFQLEVDQAVDGPSVRLAAGDFDEDGRLDLVASQSTIMSQHVFVLLNRGAFDFDVEAVPVGYGPGSVSVADVDDDGHADLVCPLNSGILRLALGDGTGAFPTLLPPDGTGVELPVPFDTTASAFADVDLDGREDLLLVTPATPLLWVATNRTVVPPH